MISYLGDFAEDATIYIPFNTFSSDDPAASVTITNLVDADIKVHKDGSVTQIVTDGATIAIDFDGITGNHLITIDTSAHADYAIGSDYIVRIEGTTVDAGTINAFVGSFSIENRFNEVNVVQLAGQTVTAAAGVTFPSSIASPTNITAGTITTVTTLTNLPAITTDWLTATGLATSAVDEIVDQVWDEVLSGHLTAGTTGAGLNAASSAGDPWATAIPGAYGAGTAGKILGDNIDSPISTAQADLDIITGSDGATISSASEASAVTAFWSDTLTTYTSGMAGKRLKGITTVPSIEGTVNDVSATTTSFISTLTGYGDTFFNDALMIVEIATDQWQSRPVATYTSATGTFTFDEAFISAPGNGVAISVVITHIHTISEIQTGLATEAKQDIIDTNVDAILLDTGTTLPATLTTIDTVVDGIQTDLDNATDGLGAIKTAVDSRMAEASINTTGGAVDVVTLVTTTTTNTDMITAAAVNAEVVDALSTDTYAEPSQGTPGATITLAAKINYLYKAWRNKSTQTATEYALYNDNTTTVDHKATVSDDGTTATKGETTTGP